MAATRTSNAFWARISKVAPRLYAVAVRDMHEWDRLGVNRSLRFALFSPIIGVLLGVLGVFILEC